MSLSNDAVLLNTQDKISTFPALPLKDTVYRNMSDKSKTLDMAQSKDLD